MLQPRAARAWLEACAVLRCSSQLGLIAISCWLGVTPEPEPPRRGLHPGGVTALACRVACVGGGSYASGLSRGAGLKVAIRLGLSELSKRHRELADSDAAFLHQGARVWRSHPPSIEKW